MDPHSLAGSPVNRVFGVVVGIVIDNKDPEKEYRVKVKFPWVQEAGDFTDAKDEADFPSTWCRIATFMSGPDRGAFWLPEVNDEVLIAFEHGDIRRPFVIGSLWNPIDPTIHDNDSQDGKNNFRTIFSRSGNVIQFQDDADNKVERIILQTKVQTGDAAKGPLDRDGHMIVIDHSDGAEQIYVSDREQKNYILIDMTNKKITIESKEGDIDILAKKGKVLIDCKELETKSEKTTKFKSGKAFSINSDSTIESKSSSTHTIKGSKVNIN